MGLYLIEQTQLRRGWRDIVAVLCLFLLAYVTIAEISHVHPGGSKHPTHACSMCSVSHNGMRVERAYVPNPLVAVSDASKTAEPSPLRLLAFSSLFIRPPPAV